MSIKHLDAGSAVENRKIFANVVYIHADVYTGMMNHCLTERPFEACGLISGKAKRCERLWKMKNMTESATSFEMSIEQLDDVVNEIEKSGEQLTGIYHSHPTAPPFPSKEDMAHVQYSDAAYFIVSFAGDMPYVKCYYLNPPEVIPVNIVVLNEK